MVVRLAQHTVSLELLTKQPPGELDHLSKE
jgi:hypothetical protein